MSSNCPVLVLWDYDSNPIPENFTMLFVVNELIQTVKPYGSVVSFLAYSSTPVLDDDQLRQLYWSGVKFSENTNQQSSVAHAVSELFSFALDHPAPATIVMITANIAYAKALSMLKLRGYHIVLITPESTPELLEIIAHEVIDWESAFAEGEVEEQPETQIASIPQPSATSSNTPAIANVARPKEQAAKDTSLTTKMQVIKDDILPKPVQRANETEVYHLPSITILNPVKEIINKAAPTAQPILAASSSSAAPKTPHPNTPISVWKLLRICRDLPETEIRESLLGTELKFAYPDKFQKGLMRTLVEYAQKENLGLVRKAEPQQEAIIYMNKEKIKKNLQERHSTR